MNGDQQYLEIISMLSELRTQMKEQKTSMDKMCDFKDIAIRTFQNFEDYKETRKNVIPDIASLKSKHAACSQECTHRKENADEIAKQVKYLMVWSYKISGIQIFISLLAAMIVVLTQLHIL